MFSTPSQLYRSVASRGMVFKMAFPRIEAVGVATAFPAPVRVSAQLLPLKAEDGNTRTRPSRLVSISSNSARMSMRALSRLACLLVEGAPAFAASVVLANAMVCLGGARCSCHCAAQWLPLTSAIPSPARRPCPCQCQPFEVVLCPQSLLMDPRKKGSSKNERICPPVATSPTNACKGSGCPCGEQRGVGSSMRPLTCSAEKRGPLLRRAHGRATAGGDNLDHHHHYSAAARGAVTTSTLIPWLRPLCWGATGGRLAWRRGPSHQAGSGTSSFPAPARDPAAPRSCRHESVPPW